MPPIFNGHQIVGPVEPNNRSKELSFLFFFFRCSTRTDSTSWLVAEMPRTNRCWSIYSGIVEHRQCWAPGDSSLQSGVQYSSSFPHLVFSRDPWRHHTTSTSAVSNLHDPQDLGRRGARIGYHKAAEKNLNFGLIQHQLAFLAYPNMLQGLVNYMKGLVSVDPFPAAGERIELLSPPLPERTRVW